MQSIYKEVYQLLKTEKTKISQKAYNVLDREGIADIIKNKNVFWFESYTIGNDCCNAVYSYLIKFIKRKMGLKYLYEMT